MESERHTDIADAIRDAGTSVDEQWRKLMERAVAGIPLGWVASGADVARAEAFLAGPEGGYLSGVALPVNGGQVMWLSLRPRRGNRGTEPLTS